VTQRFDLVIIGSGAGGGTLAHALAGNGRRILVVERGEYVPQEEENWSPEAVWKDLRYRADDWWVDGITGSRFRPYTHYCVGGNTKFWGSVLLRLRPEDFHAVEHVDGLSPPWPIDYETLAPYYDRAEQLFSVRGQHGVDPTEGPRGPYPQPPVPHAPRIAEIVERLEARGLHPFPLPLGLQSHCELCATCNSFPCRILAKSDAQVCGIDRAVGGDLELWTGSYAVRLEADAGGERVQSALIDRGGEQVRVEAPLFAVSCGAVNSAALLLRSASSKHPNGLGNSSGLVGRRYMAHLATMMECVFPFRKNETRFQKTVGINDYYLPGPHGRYPLGQIQSQGRVDGIQAKYGAPARFQRAPWTWLPPAWWRSAVGRGVDWLVMTEDLPLDHNRVTVDADGRIQLTYRPSNVQPHRQLVKETKRILWTREPHKWVTASFGSGNTTHQCGTLCFGTDPRRSVLDPFCRSHDVPNLFVVDASFFPSSAAVNPGLTVIAQALRTADHIKTTEFR
jgi:choline dehydrogenase-like flavoprotein